MRRIAEQDAMGFRGGYDDFNIPIQSVYLLSGEGMASRPDTEARPKQSSKWLSYDRDAARPRNRDRLY